MQICDIRIFNSNIWLWNIIRHYGHNRKAHTASHVSVSLLLPLTYSAIIQEHLYHVRYTTWHFIMFKTTHSYEILLHFFKCQLYFLSTLFIQHEFFSLFERFKTSAWTSHASFHPCCRSGFGYEGVPVMFNTHILTTEWNSWWISSEVLFSCATS